MTEPLIDRDMLLDLVRDGLSQAYTDDVDAAPMVSGAVLDYLREVLTPETLDPRVEWHGPKRELSRGWTDGFDLYHRIFGGER